MEVKDKIKKRKPSAEITGTIVHGQNPIAASAAPILPRPADVPPTIAASRPFFVI